MAVERTQSFGVILTPMTDLDKPTRRKVFYGMVAVFAVLTPLLLLYSKGYIVDFRGRNLVPTGGFFVKTVQPGTRVLVDADFTRETSFISHGVLVTDLVPKRYVLRVEKDGYQSWQKTVRVLEGEVLEFRNVLLPPATITPSLIFNARRQLTGRVVRLAGRKELGLEVGNPGSASTVFIINPETRITGTNLIKVDRWFWDDKSEEVIIGRHLQGKTIWFRLPSLSNPDVKEERITFKGLPAGFSAEGLWPHPKNPGEFYFFAGGALFLQGKASVPVPIAEKIQAYAVTPERIYFISDNGFFVESDLEGGNVKVLGRKGLFIDKEKPVRIIASPSGNVAVLDSSGGLFVYRPGVDAELNIIAGNVAGVDFDDKDSRMLFADSRRLWIYWLKDNRAQPFDIGGTKKQIFSSDDDVRQAYLNSGGTYAFFSTKNGIYMTEVDSRAGANTHQLVRSGVDSFVVDKEAANIYWTKEQFLYRASLK